MRATLHDHAPNPYYGQWLREKAAVCGPESPAIAHNEVIASARFVTFDVPEGDFPGNRSPVRWKFAFRPKKKNLRAKRRGVLPATIKPFLSKATAL
jgi:hypothetical protein